MTQGKEGYAEQLLDSVNAAAAAVSTRFVTFVSVGAYVAVTVASTTHEMLLRATNLVTLPLLNTQIPIIGPFGFYTIAPWLIVLLHSDLLLQLSILANELGRFDQEVSGLAEEPRTVLRQRLANFYYVLYLTGQAPSRFLHVLSAFITWITAVAIPLALLLWIQVRFLPFHSATDTWLHRGAVLADVALVLFVLLPRFAPRSSGVKVSGLRELLGWLASARTLVLLGCATAVVLSLFVITIPETAPSGGSWFARNMDLREHVLAGNALSPEDVNALRDTTEPEELRRVLAKVAPLYALQGRDLRFANLTNAVLPGLDVRALRLENVKPIAPPLPECADRSACEDLPQCEDPAVERTQLAGADFQWASMQKAMFDQAILDDADLSWAKVQYGSFAGARLNRAILANAKLQQARFGYAKLCGADLHQAQLEGAVLSGANLQGANLSGAKMAKANLERADLRGADLSGADLSDAILRDARLEGALLGGALTRGTNFEGANVDRMESSSPHNAPGDPARAAACADLVELACPSPSAAFGLAQQALRSAGRQTQGVARALLDARAKPGCPGLASLPAETVTELEAVAQKDQH